MIPNGHINNSFDHKPGDVTENSNSNIVCNIYTTWLLKNQDLAENSTHFARF